MLRSSGQAGRAGRLASAAFQMDAELRLMKNFRRSFDALERLRTSFGCRYEQIYMNGLILHTVFQPEL